MSVNTPNHTKRRESAIRISTSRQRQRQTDHHDDNLRRSCLCWRVQTHTKSRYKVSATFPKTTLLTMARSASQAKIINASLLLAGVASILVVYKYAKKPARSKSKSHSKDENEEASDPKSPSKNSSKDNLGTPLHSNKSSTGSVASASGASGESTSTEDFMAELHTQIEEIDKRGKALFRAKKHLDAAEVFTEALDLINSKVSNAAEYNNLNRQLVTLMNNRSAMYEKGGLLELALIGEFVVHYLYMHLLYMLASRSLLSS